MRNLTVISNSSQYLKQPAKSKAIRRNNGIFFSFFSLFISVFILLTRRKALETLYMNLGQAIISTCFRRCQDIVVWLNFFIFF